MESVSCLDLCADHVRLFLLGIIVATCGLVSVESSGLNERGTDDPGPVCLIRFKIVSVGQTRYTRAVHAPIAIARAWPNPSGTLSTMRSSLLRKLDIVKVEDVVVSEQGDQAMRVVIVTAAEVWIRGSDDAAPAWRCDGRWQASSA